MAQLRVLLLVLFAASLFAVGCGRNAGNANPVPPEPSKVMVPTSPTPGQNPPAPKR